MKKNYSNDKNILINSSDIETVRVSIKQGELDMKKEYSLWSVEEDNSRKSFLFDELISSQTQKEKIAQLIGSKLHNVHKNNPDAISIPGNILKGEVDNYLAIMHYAFFELSSEYHFSKGAKGDKETKVTAYTRELKAASFLQKWVVETLKNRKIKSPDKRSKDVCCETSFNIEKAEALLRDPKNKIFKNKSYFQKLELFVANYDHKMHCNWVVYSRADGKLSGRRMARSPSFQSLPKDLREVLLNDISDIDMVNCHPKIIRARSMKEGIDVAPLDYYIANRDEVLEQIASTFGCTMAHAKKLPLMVQYGASTDLEVTSKWLKEPKRAPAYVEWLKDCTNSSAKIPKVLQDYFNFLKKVRQTLGENWEGLSPASKMAMDNQIVEDNLLSFAQDFFDNKSCFVEALMFDGLMVTGDVSSMKDELTSYVNKRALDELGLDLKIEFKIRYAE